MSKIIFLNGCSSAGKTSLVREIQNLSDEFWLTFGIDSVIDAMPEKYWGKEGKKVAEGFQFVSNTDKEGVPITEVKVGPIGQKVVVLAPKIVKQLADSGFNVIVDEVIWEKKRGDRQLGMARWQFTEMKNLDWKFDLQVDTGQVSPLTNAKKILEFLKVQKSLDKNN